MVIEDALKTTTIEKHHGRHKAEAAMDHEDGNTAALSLVSLTNKLLLTVLDLILGSQLAGISTDRSIFRNISSHIYYLRRGLTT